MDALHRWIVVVIFTATCLAALLQHVLQFYCNPRAVTLQALCSSTATRVAVKDKPGMG